MKSQRVLRFGEQIQKEVSSLLVKGVKDPRIEFVTITSVDLTKDLRIAKVYYTVMGTQEQIDGAGNALKKAVPFFRRELGKRLRARHVPDLTFLYDASLEYGNRIESILSEINAGKTDDRIDTEED